MKNQEIASIFNKIADYLEMERAAFKPYTYRRAAIALEALEENIEEIYKKGKIKSLLEIFGIGKSMAEKIEEYLKTGKIKYYQDLKKKTPIKIAELTAVEGLGPKKVKALYQKLGIRNLKDLEKAAKTHKIAPLFGFDVKTEKNILEGIVFLKKSRGRFLLGEISSQVKGIYEKLKNLKEVERIDTAGSARRMKETIGDVDFLVISKNPAKVMNFFVSLPGVVKIWGKGTTKSSVRIHPIKFDSQRFNGVAEGFDMDIRVVPKRSYGSALQYFTGSKEHNIATRKIAMYKGLKLSEYGLFRGSKMIVGETEEGIYKALGMQWIPPEMRENQGEIEAALKKKLPRIIGYNDIRGDLHVHTVWSDGKQTIEQMVLAAKAMGYKYLGISDHSKLPVANGLDEKRFLKQIEEIAKLSGKIRGIKILKGAEINILENGSLDIKDEMLAKLDYVIAGIHSGFKMEKEKMTERIIKAMKNPRVDIIAHLTSRKMNQREECQIDLDKILRAAKEYDVVLEINSQPIRLDLKDVNIRRAKEVGVRMVINTDAHHKDQLRLMEFGVAQARRGWAEREDIINTQSIDKLIKSFKK